jgi:hypothetical protein
MDDRRNPGGIQAEHRVAPRVRARAAARTRIARSHTHTQSHNSNPWEYQPHSPENYAETATHVSANHTRPFSAAGEQTQRPGRNGLMAKVNGHLYELEREDLDAMRARQERTSRERFEGEVRRAIVAGFSEREAPFAASARLSRGPTTVARMRAYLEATYPQFYEEDRDER